MTRGLSSAEATVPLRRAVLETWWDVCNEMGEERLDRYT